MRFQKFLEMRDRNFQYLQSLVPSWPPYVVQDFIYKGFKNKPDKAKQWLQYLATNNGFGTANEMQWQLTTVHITFDVFDQNTKIMLQERIEEEKARQQGIQTPDQGNIGGGAVKNQQRMNTQADLLKKQPSQEPIIVVQHPQGLRLEEGWHRTVVTLINLPQGYNQKAYVLNASRAYDEPNDNWGQDA